MVNSLLVNNCYTNIYVKVANTWFKRTIGWLGRKIDIHEALWITPCKCVHTIGMKESIDVLFLNKQNQVIYILNELMPGNISPFIKEAYSIVEMKSKVACILNIQVGDMISIDLENEKKEGAFKFHI